METPATVKPQSYGGRATAIILRRQVVEKYYANPNLCKECGSVICVNGKEKIQQVRRRKFCNNTCAAKHNNRLRGRTPKIKEVKSKKEYFLWVNQSKGNLKSMMKSWQSFRSMIQRHARLVLKDVPKKCHVCDYEKHVEVAHLNSVSQFPIETTIKEINDINNLIYLCPNHHWEYDNGHLSELKFHQDKVKSA